MQGRIQEGGAAPRLFLLSFALLRSDNLTVLFFVLLLRSENLTDPAGMALNCTPPRFKFLGTPLLGNAQGLS